MGNLKGSRTEKNLLTAFAGGTQYLDEHDGCTGEESAGRYTP